MTEEPNALPRPVTPGDDTEEQQRPDADHGRPVSDGPATVHPNADTSHSAVNPSRMTHKF